MVERRAKEVPSYTKPMGKPGDERVRPAKSDYAKFDKEEPFQGPSKGGYHNVGSKGKCCGSDGAERVRQGKVDYTKFDKEEPFQGPSKGGYKNVGKGAKGAERTEGAYKKKSPWR